jgi:hypothetical protein
VPSPVADGRVFGWGWAAVSAPLAVRSLARWPYKIGLSTETLPAVVMARRPLPPGARARRARWGSGSSRRSAPPWCRGSPGKSTRDRWAAQTRSGRFRRCAVLTAAQAEHRLQIARAEHRGGRSGDLRQAGQRGTMTVVGAFTPPRGFGYAMVPATELLPRTTTGELPQILVKAKPGVSASGPHGGAAESDGQRARSRRREPRGNSERRTRSGSCAAWSARARSSPSGPGPPGRRRRTSAGPGERRNAGRCSCRSRKGPSPR